MFGGKCLNKVNSTWELLFNKRENENHPLHSSECDIPLFLIIKNVLFKFKTMV